MVRLAFRAIAEAGLKATKTVQVAPAAREGPQAFCCSNEVGLAPVSAMELTVTGRVPAFLIRMVWAMLVAPVTVLGKDRDAGVKVSVGTATPVPESATF